MRGSARASYRYPAKTSLGGASHDITPVTWDVMAYIDYGGSGGMGGSGSDSVIEIDNTGTTKEVFKATNHLSSCHLNALRWDEGSGVYTISDLSSDIFMVERNCSGIPPLYIGQIVRGNIIRESA